ncbi:MAG TPA: hypothetical protein VKZ96_17680, partial [Thermomicrobiales bacterium]|nr:hypothetical protein [Thermomicrobiales bacterium]
MQRSATGRLPKFPARGSGPGIRAEFRWDVTQEVPERVPMGIEVSHEMQALYLGASLLVAEMALTGEQHGDAGGVRGGDHL